MEKQKIEEFLTRHPLFIKTKKDFISSLANDCEILNLDSGQVLFSSGEKAAGGFIVVSGLIRLFMELPGKEGQTLRFVSECEAFAEPMMFGQELYPVCAEAIEKTKVILIHQKTVLEELRANPDLALSLLQSLSVRLKYHIQTIKMLTALDPMLRILMYLQDHLVTKGTSTEWRDVSFSLSRKDLASQLNLAPETVSRLYKRLLTHKIVVFKSQRIHLVHLERLDKHLIELLRKKTTKARKS